MSQARGMVAQFAHPALGELPGAAGALQVRRLGRAGSRSRPPLLGEHTDEVLAGRLGYDAARIAALREGRRDMSEEPAALRIDARTAWRR